MFDLSPAVPKLDDSPLPEIDMLSLNGEPSLEWAAKQTPRISSFLQWCQAHKHIKVRCLCIWCERCSAASCAS